jgi:hypothetical protein
MKTQVALRLEDRIIESAKRVAERQNRSLANLVEGLLADSLTGANGNLPVISLLEGDIFDGAVMLNDDDTVNDEDTDTFHHLLAVSRQERPE